MVNNTQIFEHMTNWLAKPPSLKNERYLWIFDRKTKEICWKNRKIYSPWQRRESGLIQEVFKKMSDQLASASHLAAENKDQFALLLKLRERIKTQYEGFLSAHRSFFGMFYKLIFAYFLEDHYDNLQNRLDKVLENSFKKIEISSLTPKDIDFIVAFIKKKSVHPSLSINWEKMSLEQFKSAYVLKKYATPMTLSSLDKEKTAYLLEQNENALDEFDINEIENNSDKIETRFLVNLKQYSKKHSKINVSKFNVDQIIEILENERVGTAYDLATIAPALCNCNKFVEALKKNPSLLKMLSPDVIAVIFTHIDPSNYKKLNYKQLIKIDFSQFTGDQFLKLKNEISFIPPECIKQLDLNLFTTDNIKELSTKICLKELSPQTLAANLDKFEPSMLKKLSLDQIQALNISKLSVDLIDTHYLFFTNQQWSSLDLSTFAANSMDKVLSNRSWILPLLSTKNANLAAIPTKYYHHFKDQQLQEIDFLALTDAQREAFYETQIISMKNFIPNSNLTTWWPCWWKYFVKKSQETKNENPDLKLQIYNLKLSAAIEEIKKQNKPHSNPTYENLRQKCLTGMPMNNPSLILFDPSLGQQIGYNYKKLVLNVHSEKNADRAEEAAKLFELINAAYKYSIATKS